MSAFAAAAIAGASATGIASCSLANPSLARVGLAPSALGADTVTFASASGSTIHAWFARGRPGAGGVLLLHGVGADRRVMADRARFLHSAGYAVLVLDFQAHGESPGRHVTYGALESLDAAAALAFLRDQVPGERLGVIGVSMGGAAALVGSDGPLRADALVLESVYPTIRDAVRDRLRVWLGPIGPAFAPMLLSVVGQEIGVAEADLRPIDRIGRVDAPVLVASGTNDRYTTLAETRLLFANAADPKELWVVDGAAHVDLYAFAPAEYERRVGGFLARHLRGAMHMHQPVLAGGATR
jgi:fermentation-respiration switch protein FrsA (DUF1100 family)